MDSLFEIFSELKEEILKVPIKVFISENVKGEEIVHFTVLKRLPKENFYDVLNSITEGLKIVRPNARYILPIEKGVTPTRIVAVVKGRLIKVLTELMISY